MTSPLPPPSVKARVVASFGGALRATSPKLVFGEDGYVSDFTQNLLPQVQPADFEADLRQGSGRELDGKFRAPHSSSALAVNCFAPFRHHGNEITFGGAGGLSISGFEQKCSVGLRRGTPPNLDLVLEGPDRVIGIESKCTEYLSSHAAEFAPAYFQEITDSRRGSAWFAEMQRLSTAPADYRWLDAAQLIKHAFGLAKTYPDTQVQLLYLYWEPPNAGEFAIFAEHRAEIARLSARVAHSRPAFSAMSYAELWASWAQAAPPEWLRQHLADLHARYFRPI